MTITTDMECLFSKVLPQHLLHKLSSTKALRVSQLHLLSGTGLITIGSMFFVLSVVCFNLIEEI